MPTEQEISHEQGLRPLLSAGQMAMVAVGGSIGTGLLLGSAAAIGIAGPSVILSFFVAAFINWTVAMALGELASMHPAAGSWGVYAELYLNSWAGFVSRGGYWAAIAISVGAELVASATYMGYWFPTVPRLVWVSVFSLAILLINQRSVDDYGRFEFWFAMIKVATIAAFIVIGSALLMSGQVVPQYTTQGGFFPNGFFAPLLALSFALYTFGGVEMVAVTTGESRSPKDISLAVLWTFATLTTLYVGAMVVLVGVMPWNRAGVMESPFVTVFRTAQIPGVTHFMNFVVLTAALSGANAAIYISSRMLFSLARTGWAPPAFGKLNAAGVPRLALLVSSFGILVAVVLEKWAPQSAFVSILGAALFGLLLSWLVSLAAHVSFRRRATPGELAALAMRSPAGAWASVLGFTLVCAAILKTWWDSRLSLVSGLVYLLLLTMAWVALKSRRQGVQR
jgi:L-asparagine transporter-like permease